MKRIPHLLVVAAIMALIFSVALTGCGSKESAAPSASTTTTESPSTGETTPPSTTEPVGTDSSSTPAPEVSPATPATAQPAGTAAATSNTSKTAVTPPPAAASSPAPAKTTAPAKPAAPVTKTTAPAAVTVPASLTGAKADAYKLLMGCKYSGSAQSSWNATMLDVPILGDVDMKVTTNGNTVTGQGVPSTVGGDFTGRKLSAIPFNEAISGNPTAVEAFLKTASSVSVSGNAIKVSGQPPTSIVTLLNTVAPGKVTWAKKDLTMTCTINVGTGKVSRIEADLNGTCTAPLGKIKGKVNGKVSY